MAPGQNAFCAKICSKIITSQFCVVLLNNDTSDGRETPNANVNMEYGLMIGFNKYVVPFQRAEQTLPFNVAGLDTIKYTQRDFESRAAQAIDVAIAATRQEAPAAIQPDQLLETFLLSRKYLVARIDSDGDRNLYDMGRPFGFYLLHDFSGMRYTYFGNFAAFRPEACIWRVKMLVEVLAGRAATIDMKVEAGVADPKQGALLKSVLTSIDVVIVVNADDDKIAVLDGLPEVNLDRSIEVFSLNEVRADLEALASIVS